MMNNLRRAAPLIRASFNRPICTQGFSKYFHSPLMMANKNHGLYTMSNTSSGQALNYSFTTSIKRGFRSSNKQKQANSGKSRRKLLKKATGIVLLAVIPYFAIKYLGKDQEIRKKKAEEAALETDSELSNLGYNDPDYYKINEKFEKALKILESNETKTLVVYGPPGAGKSSFARRFAHDYYLTNNKECHLLNAEDTALIDAFYLQCLELPFEELQNNKYIELLNERSKEDKTRKFLFVFDNAKSVDAVEKYIKDLPPNMRAIITTREKDPRYASLEFSSFTHEEARDFLKKIVKKIDETEINELISTVGTLPQKLRISADYFNTGPSESIKEFLSEYQELSKQKNIKDPFYELIFQKLIKRNPNAWKLLEYISHLDPNFIHSTLVSKMFGPPEAWKSTRDLKSWSLLEETCQGDLAGYFQGYRIHKVIQENCQEYSKHAELSTPEDVIYRDLIHGVFNEYGWINPTNFEHFEKDHIIYSHAKKIVEKASLSNDDVLTSDERVADFLVSYGSSCYAKRKYNEALVWYEKALKRYNNMLDSDKEQVGICLNNIALAYEALGKSEEALKYRQLANEKEE